MVITCKYGEYMGTYFYGSPRTSGVKHRGRTCTSCINVKKTKCTLLISASFSAVLLNVN
uniref:Uncharacterized protein n=1 Tax=Anguilla anguilla TaxID=7936 RepID=A0A0E9RWM8_ANGAN